MKTYLFDMSTALFYDSETTGFPNGGKLVDPSQPRIVQMAACLVDLDSRKTISSIDVVINPDVHISEHVANVHGITRTIASTFGTKPSSAMLLFHDMWTKAAVRIAHNQTFDQKMVAIELANIYGEDSIMVGDWQQGKTACTMLMAHPLTKDHKSGWPNLSFCHEHLLGQSIDGAHNAMVDVLACIELYFHLVDMEKINGHKD